VKKEEERSDLRDGFGEQVVYSVDKKKFSSRICEMRDAGCGDPRAATG
jgi:hypothetical protein